MQPDKIIISELTQHALGRSHGEAFDILRQELLKLGCPAKAIDHVETELEALERTLTWSQPGDLLVLLILGEADEVRERLAELPLTTQL